MADKTVDWFAESNRYAVALMEQGLKAEQDKDKPRVQKIVANGAILADLVEVCRCKGCKQWSRNIGIADSPNGHCFCHDIETNGHDFCSYGERREGE